GQQQTRPIRQPRLSVERLDERSLPSANFLQTNLVSDLPGLAQIVDNTLHGAQGISLSPNGGAFWVSSTGGNVSELYLGDIDGVPIKALFKVTIPGGSPTGQVFNLNQPIMSNGNSTDFSITDGQNTGASVFIFATDNGTIVGWNPAVGAQIPFGNGTISGTGIVGFAATDGADYKGLAAGTFQRANFLWAADLLNGKIDVINGQFQKVTLGQNGFGTFADPNLPAGFAPTSISNIGGNLFVTYAAQDATRHNIAPGSGFVDVFDTGGHLLRRLISNGPLNAPVAAVMAGSNFGTTFSKALLIGNNGDGTINAFDPRTGAFLGQLQDANGNSIHIAGLTALAFGNGTSSGQANSLFFSASL